MILTEYFFFSFTFEIDLGKLKYQLSLLQTYIVYAKCILKIILWRVFVTLYKYLYKMNMCVSIYIYLFMKRAIILYENLYVLSFQYLF